MDSAHTLEDTLLQDQRQKSIISSPHCNDSTAKETISCFCVMHRKNSNKWQHFIEVLLQYFSINLKRETGLFEHNTWLMCVISIRPSWPLGIAVSS